MVEDFSSRQFSYDTDKLTAFAGTASLFNSRKGNVEYETENRMHGKPVYLAGIWSNFLLQSLLWRPYFATTNSRPKQYVAPSC